jgi:hypothetical protein
MMDPSPVALAPPPGVPVPSFVLSGGELVDMGLLREFRRAGAPSGVPARGGGLLADQPPSAHGQNFPCWRSCQLARANTPARTASSRVIGKMALVPLVGFAHRAAPQPRATQRCRARCSLEYPSDAAHLHQRVLLEEARHAHCAPRGVGGCRVGPVAGHDGIQWQVGNCRPGRRAGFPVGCRDRVDKYAAARHHLASLVCSTEPSPRPASGQGKDATATVERQFRDSVVDGPAIERLASG